MYNAIHRPTLRDRFDRALTQPTFLAAIRAFFVRPAGTPLSRLWGL